MTDRILVQTERGIRPWTTAEHVAGFAAWALVLGVASLVAMVMAVGVPKRSTPRASLRCG